MRKKLLLTLFIILMLSVSLFLTSCLEGLQLPSFGGQGDDDSDDDGSDDGGSTDDGNDDGGSTDDGNDDGGSTDDGGDDTEEPDYAEPEPEPVTYKFRIMYRTHEGLQTLKTFDVPEAGYTDEQLDYIDALTYGGYDLDDFFYEPTFVTRVDFEAPLTRDTAIYCWRDTTKAGKNVTWSVVENEYSGYTLKFEGTGDMYPYIYHDQDVPWYFDDNYSHINRVEIPEGITSIADNAFYGFEDIDTVELPSTLLHIGKGAFSMSSISSIEFPEGLKSIGENAFKSCNNITFLEFNSQLETIEKGAFHECKSITTMVLTESVMELGGSAFYACDGLTVYYTGSEAQYNQINVYLDNFWATDLAVTYFLSEETPTSPGPYWYHDNDGNIRQWYNTIWYMYNSDAKVYFTRDFIDATVGVTQANVDFLKSVTYNGYRFARFNLYDKQTGTVSSKEFSLSLGEKLNEDIRVVGDRGDFCGDNLKWKFSSGILTISKIDASNPDGEMWDFADLIDAPWYNRRGSIIRVEFGEGVTYIGKNAFIEIKSTSTLYKNFSFIEIPTSVTEIHKNAFSGCSHLLYIYYKGTRADMYGDGVNPPRITGLAELESIGDATVYVNATGENFANLAEGAYWCYLGFDRTRRLAWIYDEARGHLTVGGGDDLDKTAQHQLPNFEAHSEVPWYSYRNNVTKVTINKNIHTVGHYVFTGMESVMTIEMPATVTYPFRISPTAFVGTGYYNTEFEKGAVYIGKHLIAVNPASITGDIYVIPEGTISIAGDAFSGCTMVTKLVMPNNIGDDIYSTSLTGLTNLQEIYFMGSEDAWASYSNIPNATVYFYSSNAPEDEGNYWKYGENNSIVIW